jgi:hypothetical protein
VVLRNGIEIGRGRIQLDDHDDAVHVLTLTQNPDGGRRWIYAGLPGHESEKGATLGDAEIGRLRAPRPFYDRVEASLKRGDSVVVTPAPIGDGAVGHRLTIIDAMGEPKASHP